MIGARRAQLRFKALDQEKRKVVDLGLVMLGAAALSVVALMLFAMFAAAGLFYPALVMTFATSVFAAVFMISSMTVLQLSVPDELRGRVMGIHTMGYSLMPLGGLFLGVLAEVTGAAHAVLIGSSIFLFGIIGVGLAAAAIRRLDGTAIGMHESGA